MNTLKNSGTEWLGDIPKNWETIKFNSLYKQRSEKVSDKDYEPLSVTKNGIKPQLSSAAKTNNGDNRKLVKIGDFVINSRSDRRGSCGISSLTGSVSLINTVLTPLNNEMNPNYYDWLFHTTQFADEFYKWGHGIVDDLWSTNWQDMKNIILLFPPYSEQKIISKYLDKKCSEIDHLLIKLKEEVNYLEKYKKSKISEVITKGLNKTNLKDTNIRWIGKIPENWSTVKVKYTSSLKGRIGWQGLNSSEYEEIGPYLITGTDFNKGVVDWNKCVHITKNRFDQAPEIQIKEGDLLVTKDGTVGKVAIAKDCPKEVSINSGILLVRNNRKIKCEERFFYYVILSDEFWNWFMIDQSGNSTIMHLYQERFYQFKYAIPPIDEQKEIVNFLDKKCFELDKIIEDKERQLSLLYKYKQSIIFEYTTGKKRVNYKTGD